MKKIFFLFVLIFMSSVSFCQMTPSDSLKHVYGNIQNINTYLKEVNSNIKELNTITYKSGDYLTRGKNQLIGGLLCQTIAIGTIVYTLTAEPPTSNRNESTSEYNKRLDSWANTQKTIDYGAGALSLIGLMFEISGLNNIGKAGIILNGNSVGVKVNF